MNNPWFKRLGWFDRPNSWQGVASLVLVVIFCVQVFVAIDRHSYSVSDTLYGVFPYFACCFLLLNWVAANTTNLKSEPEEHEQQHAGSTEV